MKTLLWKEWRENARWALLGLALLGGAQIYALRQLANLTQDYYQHPEQQGLCSPLFLMTTTYGGIVVGLLLGLLQTLPERAADRWAFLVHRPVPAGRLFLGKALAGLSLYALAVLPPTLASAWWMATPGHLCAPFVPAMTGPGLLDLLAGVAWYFAAMLVGIRDVRWYGTRLLPLAAAWCVTLHVRGCWIAGQAVGYALWIVPILAAAAGAAVATGGGTKALSGTGRLAFFALFSLAGYTLIYAGGDAVLPAFLDPKPQQAVYRGYKAAQDGTAYLRAYSQATKKTSYTGLDGKELDADGLHLDEWRYEEAYFVQTRPLFEKGPRTPGPLPHDNSYRVLQHYVEPGNLSQYNFGNAEIPSWFYLPGERRFRGWSWKTRSPLGLLGVPGTDGAPFPEPLADTDNMNSGSLLLFPHAAYSFDERRGALTPLADPEGEGKRPFFGVTALTNVLVKEEKTAGRKEEKGLFFVTAIGGEIVFYDEAGRVLARTPHLRDPRAYGNVTVGKPDGIGSGWFVWYWPEKNWEKKQPGYFERLDEQGKRVFETLLPYAPNTDNPKFWWDLDKKYLHPFLGVAWVWGNRYLQAHLNPAPRHGEKEWWAWVRAHPREERLLRLKQMGWGIASAVLGLAWLAFARSGGSRVWWTLGLFAMGPGALFALPVLAPRERKTKAAPAPSGSEIFEKEPEPV